MKRREILKKLGIGALSLAGIVRLTKAMATSAPPEEVICALTTDGEGVYLKSCPPGGLYTCPGANYHCGQPYHPYFICNLFVCPANFSCNPAQGDFTCELNFLGCNYVGSFACSGTDTGAGDHQFNCSAAFTGCRDGGKFTCEDFYCKSHYDCGTGATCPSGPPFSCAQPPGNPYSTSIEPGLEL